MNNIMSNFAPAQSTDGSYNVIANVVNYTGTYNTTLTNSYYYDAIVTINDVNYDTTSGSAVVTGTSSSSPNLNLVIQPTITIGVTPYNVVSIQNSAFSNTTNLTSITIPNSITFIDSSVFLNCSALSSVQFPQTVSTPTIEIDTFAGFLQHLLLMC